MCPAASEPSGEPRPAAAARGWERGSEPACALRRDAALRAVAAGIPPPSVPPRLSESERRPPRKSRTESRAQPDLPSGPRRVLMAFPKQIGRPNGSSGCVPAAVPLCLPVDLCAVPGVRPGRGCARSGSAAPRAEFLRLCEPRCGNRAR